MSKWLYGHVGARSNEQCSLQVYGKSAGGQVDSHGIGLQRVPEIADDGYVVATVDGVVDDWAEEGCTQHLAMCMTLGEGEMVFAKIT